MTEYQPMSASRHVLVSAPISQSFRPSVWVRVWGWFRRLK